MPLPSSIADLSQTAGSNSPAGSESPSLIDDYLRTHASYIALLRDQSAYAPQTIASAATTDIGAAISNVIYVSGTTTITALGTAAAGVIRTVKFLGALVLTHNATSLILPGTANITTAANDTAEFLSLGSGNWQCTRYTPASGLYGRYNILGTVSQASGIPTGAVIEAGSNATGTFTKFADGRMICTLLILGLSININTAYGSGTLGTANWSFPAAFISTPIAYMGARGSGKFTTTSPADGMSSTVGQFFVFDPAGGVYTGSFNSFFLAIGRWF